VDAGEVTEVQLVLSDETNIWFQLGVITTKVLFPNPT